MRREIILRQTYRTDIKVINDMPPLSKKRRYAKFAMSLVGRDMSTGFFETLKAAILIIIEDEIENELSAYDIWHTQFCEEWHLLHEFPDDAEGEDGGNDVFDEDHFDDICKANALLSEQCEAVFSAEDSFSKWRSNGSTSNLRGRGNSRTTYYRNKQKEAVTKKKAKGTADIRGFYLQSVSLQIEEESEDDTEDEMRNECDNDNTDVEATENIHSIESAMESMLPLINISRNKRVEAKKDTAAWEYQRILALYRYLQLRMSGFGKMEASGESAKLYYLKTGSECYKARSIRQWTQQYLLSGNFVEYKQGNHHKTSAIIMNEVVQSKFREALRGMSDQDRLPIKFQIFSFLRTY